MKALFVIGLLWCFALLSGYGDETTSGRIANSVGNTFTEDSGGRPSPTPAHHRKSAAKHLSSKKTPAKHSESATRETDDSENASKANPISESSRKAKEDTAGPADGAEKPSSTPANDEGTGSDVKKSSETAAPMVTIKPEELREFSEQPAKVQELIRNSLALTERNLSYKYGSADPAAGGMDCSGFIYYVLTNAGYKDVPRDSSGQYAWVRKQGDFHAVLSRSGESFELNDLSPGDLLFWSGTYKVERDIPITHVMIYLGKEKSTGKSVMVGATDGRSYNGVRRFGVSVFDFKMPSGKPNAADPDLTSKFEGYASIPHLREADDASNRLVNREQQNKADKETPEMKSKSQAGSLGDGD
jgi:cell wall-associated NlpC family hydrolase